MPLSPLEMVELDRASAATTLDRLYDSPGLYRRLSHAATDRCGDPGFRWERVGSALRDTLRNA